MAHHFLCNMAFSTFNGLNKTSAELIYAIFFFWTDKSRQSFLTADETEAKLLPVDKKVCHQLGRKLM